jgi:hypothetical protein
MIVRCPDFSDANKVDFANKEIKDEVRDLFGNDFMTEAQYDYVTKPFASIVKQFEQTTGESQAVVKKLRGVYKNLEEEQDTKRDIREIPGVGVENNTIWKLFDLDSR